MSGTSALKADALKIDESNASVVIEPRRAGVAEDEAGPREGPTGALSRGLALLSVLLETPSPLTLAELAAASGLEQSTSLRLLRTLEEAGQVLRTSDGRKYLPSPRALRPLPLMHPVDQLRREAATLLQDVSNRIGKTVACVLYLGIDRLAIDVALSPGALTPFYESWMKRPLHCTAVGKARLASLDELRMRAVLGNDPYPVLTAHTLSTWQALSADLAHSRERGWFVARDEHREGLTAVAANIPGGDGGAVGCLVATGHTVDFEGDAMPATGEAIRRAALLLPMQAPSLRSASMLLRR